MSFKSLILIAAAYAGYKYVNYCGDCAKEDKQIDKASKASFPASDPPSGNQFTSTEPRNPTFQSTTPAHP
jgi:hypothetical protein